MNTAERVEKALLHAQRFSPSQPIRVLAAALREAQAEATKWRRQAGREGFRANEAEAENARLAIEAATADQDWKKAQAENERLRACVDLLRPEEVERFWHLYRTHPHLDALAPADEAQHD